MAPDYDIAIRDPLPLHCADADADADADAAAAMLFVRNQCWFYMTIARAHHGNGNGNSVDKAVDKVVDQNQNSPNSPNHPNHANHPLLHATTLHGVPIIVSAGVWWSFYNALFLEVDTFQSQNQNQHEQQQQQQRDEEEIVDEAVAMAKKYRVPLRCTVNPQNIERMNMLKRHKFIQMPNRVDSFQHRDLEEADIEKMEQQIGIHSQQEQKHEQKQEEWTYIGHDKTVLFRELKKMEPELQAQFGHVLVKAFGFKQAEKTGKFFADVWRVVPVGDGQPIKMVLAIKEGKVIGGAQVCLANGIATLFNVVNLHEYRGKGIGKILSLLAMKVAKRHGYRHMILQASPAGSPVYKRLGFKPIPPATTFVKIATADWYCPAVEALVLYLGDTSILWGNTKPLKKLAQKAAATTAAFAAITFAAVRMARNRFAMLD